jgi:hypothetical protein
MRRILIGIALLGIGCGAQTPDEVVKATGAVTSLPDHPAHLTAPAFNSLLGVLIQVPIGTPRQQQATFGQGNSYPMLIGTQATLSKGPTYNNILGGTDDLELVTSPIGTAPRGDGQDIHCVISLPGGSVLPAAENFYFTTQLGNLFSGRSMYSNMYWPANGFPNTGTPGRCHTDDNTGGGWDMPIAMATAGYYRQTDGPPDALLQEMFLRIDIDFPAYGVTNRWYYGLTAD